MKFIVDAQLPARLCLWLREHRHDCIHTESLPAANRTTDAQVLDIAEREQRCVVTKDSDFQTSFELGRGPQKLLLITTGNLPNDDLIEIFQRHEAKLFEAVEKFSFVELRRDTLIVHA